jgi:hypothetical protein
VAKGIDNMLVVTLKHNEQTVVEGLRYDSNHPATKGLGQIKKELMRDAIRKHMEEGNNDEELN